MNFRETKTRLTYPVSILLLLVLTSCANPRPDTTWEHAGVLVEAVEPKSTAAEAGVSAGDRIIGYADGWGYVDITSKKQLLAVLEIRFNQQRSINLGLVKSGGKEALAAFWVKGNKTAGMTFPSD